MDRVGATGFVPLEALSFKTLTSLRKTTDFTTHPRDYVKQQLGYAGMNGVQ